MTLNSAVTVSDLPELFISTVWNIRVNDVKYNEANVNIEIMGKGPYIVKGKVNIFDAGGNELDVKKRSDCAMSMR